MYHSICTQLFALAAIAVPAQTQHGPDHDDSIGAAKSPPRAYPSEPLDDVTTAVPPTSDAPALSIDGAGRALDATRDRMHYDVAADGTVWARGGTYKASFARDAATYIPFLGSDAPRNHPLGLRVQSVTLAGQPIAFDSAAPAVRRGDTVEYARGPFRERYLMTPDSVEQTFEFDELASRGELVVTVAVTTDSIAVADGDGFRFENELGHVRYGRAFVYDDASAAAPIVSRLAGGVIELVAPADLVERTTGRLVIDPVLTTFAVESSTLDEFSADTAYDLTNGVWLTVSEDVFSATDHDIHVVRHSSAGTISALDYVDISADDWRAPAVANDNLDDQFLVVAAVGVAPDREVWGRTVEATVGLNLSAQFRISVNGAFGDQYAPDVGGDPSTSAPAYYCVVWEREFTPGVDYDIHGRTVRTDTTFVTGTLFIDDTAGSIHRNPAISNSNGNATNALQDWNVVWEDEVSSTNRNILGARVHWDGTLSDPTFTVASSILDERNPSATSIVDENGGTRPWMVSFQVDSGTNGWDVRCRTFDGTAIISTFDLSEQFSSVALDQITPSCDTNDGQFVVVYDERTAPVFFSTDIKVSTLYSLGGALGVNEGNLSAAPGNFTDLRPRVAASGSSGSAIDTAMIVFDRDVSGPNDVYATRYSIPDGGPVSGYCFGDGSGTACPCGNVGAAGHGCASSLNASGALLGSSGSADVSSDDLTLVASGLPASAPVLFFQGTSQSGAGSGTVFGDGLRCASGTVTRLGTKMASSGTATYPVGTDPDVSVRGGVPATGALRFYQGWYRNSAAFCTSATFNLTNGLRVQWIP